jgi:hypothetical protein
LRFGSSSAASVSTCSPKGLKPLDGSRNIRRNPKVTVRIGEWQIDATARVLDRQADRKLWDQVAAMADHKYGWGEGLPVEITPFP